MALESVVGTTVPEEGKILYLSPLSNIRKQYTLLLLSILPFSQRGRRKLEANEEKEGQDKGTACTPHFWHYNNRTVLRDTDCIRSWACNLQGSSSRKRICNVSLMATVQEQGLKKDTPAPGVPPQGTTHCSCLVLQRQRWRHVALFPANPK
jgi:hypothetical protein